ncbi:hypothetical protein ACOMHN_018200 [Nucella lapillus]
MNGCTDQSKLAVERLSEKADETQTTDHHDDETEKEEGKADGQKEESGKQRRKKADGQRKESVKQRRNKSQNAEEIPDDGVPYDTGWAWMIVLGGFVNFVVAAGYNRATFIFFVNFLEVFRAPVTETALLFGVKAGISSLVGLFIMNAAVGRFGARRTVFVGGCCMALSAILGSIARDVPSLIITQALFHGLGMSMLNMPSTVLLGYYFRRRRSLANSITKCGVGVGAVAFPPFATFLLRHYGLRGAMLLMGAICLHALPAAMLLRPVSFYKKKKKHQQQKDGAEECSRTLLSNDISAKEDNSADATRNRSVDATVDGLVDYTTNRSLDAKVEVGVTSCSGETQGQTKLSPLPYHLLEAVDLSKSAPSLNSLATDHFRRRACTFSDHESTHRTNEKRPGHFLDALSQSSMVRYMSVPDLELDTPCVVFPPADQAPNSSPHGQSRTSRSCLSRVVQLARQIVGVLDFGLFHSPMFRLLVVFFICSPLVHASTTYLAAMVAERNIDQDQAAILLSIIGGLDFCCRLACGFLADLKIMRVSTMIGVAFTILGVACQLTRFMTTFSHLIGFAVVQGLLGGVAACLMPILIMEDIGLENTAKALGFMKLFMGGAMAAFHPLLGYIRDSTGSYDVAYNVIGAFTLLSAGLILCLRFLPHTLPPASSHPPESSPLKPNPSADHNSETKAS